MKLYLINTSKLLLYIFLLLCQEVVQSCRMETSHRRYVTTAEEITIVFEILTPIKDYYYFL